MKIGYRRFSGKIPLSAFEAGGTGLWLEKRWALLQALRTRGAEIVFLSQPSKYSQYEFIIGDPKDCDVILIEFGSTNALSYGPDIQLTKEIITNKQIPTVYILDDPDLFSAVTRECAAFWINARNLDACQRRFTSKSTYFPIAALQTASYIEPEFPKGIYIGSGKGGREQIIIDFKNEFPAIDVFGDHFEQLAPFPRPPQPIRYATYGKYLFSIGINDNTHKRFDWNTGRMTHSVMAGTPYITRLEELAEVIRNPEAVWQRQYDGIIAEKAIALERLEELWTLTI